MMPMMMFIGNLGYVVMCILGGYLVIQKTIQVGDILAFIQYVRSFTQPLAQVANMVNILQSTAAAAERVFEFLGEEEEAADPANPVAIPKSSAAASPSEMFLSVIIRPKLSLTISAPIFNRDKKSPSSDRPGPARPPWSNC